MVPFRCQWRTHAQVLLRQRNEQCTCSAGISGHARNEDYVHAKRQYRHRSFFGSGICSKLLRKNTFFPDFIGQRLSTPMAIVNRARLGLRSNLGHFRYVCRSGSAQCPTNDQHFVVYPQLQFAHQSGCYPIGFNTAICGTSGINGDRP